MSDTKPAVVSTACSEAMRLAKLENKLLREVVAAQKPAPVADDLVERLRKRLNNYANIAGSMPTYTADDEALDVELGERITADAAVIAGKDAEIERLRVQLNEANALLRRWMAV